MRTYEGMFLLDAGNPDFESAAAPVRDVLARANAEVLSLKPWDERRLAYEIKGRRRALYVLTYFRADPAVMQSLHHDIQLDERILRALILSADHVTEEVIHAETPATLAQARKAAAEAEKAARAARAREAAAQAEKAEKAADKAEAESAQAEAQDQAETQAAENAPAAEAEDKAAAEAGPEGTPGQPASPEARSEESSQEEGTRESNP